MATPIHDGVRTPLRDRAWNPYTPPGSPPSETYEAPTPGSGWANTPGGNYSEAGTSRNSSSAYANAPSSYFPSTPGGQPPDTKFGIPTWYTWGQPVSPVLENRSNGQRLKVSPANRVVNGYKLLSPTEFVDRIKGGQWPWTSQACTMDYYIGYINGGYGAFIFENVLQNPPLEDETEDIPHVVEQSDLEFDKVLSAFDSDAILDGLDQPFLNLIDYLDASCNGIQHYAALGRDRLGADVVNLIAGGEPADVYSGVVSRWPRTQQKHRKCWWKGGLWFYRPARLICSSLV
ncbi:hypothetical protein AgCh_016387 [Apium graveolens]